MHFKIIYKAIRSEPLAVPVCLPRGERKASENDRPVSSPDKLLVSVSTTFLMSCHHMRQKYASFNSELVDIEWSDLKLMVNFGHCMVCIWNANVVYLLVGLGKCSSSNSRRFYSIAFRKDAFAWKIT